MGRGAVCARRSARVEPGTGIIEQALAPARKLLGRRGHRTTTDYVHLDDAHLVDAAMHVTETIRGDGWGRVRQTMVDRRLSRRPDLIDKAPGAISPA